jgi:hypothetical protein
VLECTCIYLRGGCYSLICDFIHSIEHYSLLKKEMSLSFSRRLRDPIVCQ